MSGVCQRKSYKEFMVNIHLVVSFQPKAVVETMLWIISTRFNPFSLLGYFCHSPQFAEAS